MGIIDSIKSWLNGGVEGVTDVTHETAGSVSNAGATVSDTASSAASSVSDSVSSIKDSIIDKVTDIPDFKFDVSSFTGMVDKFGLMDKLPEELKAKISDGSISDEDVEAYIRDHKEEISAFAAAHKDEVMAFIKK